LDKKEKKKEKTKWNHYEYENCFWLWKKYKEERKYFPFDDCINDIGVINKNFQTYDKIVT
jgi:hypothetical protein